MSKFSLDIEEDFDFFMLGICSHIKDYRLCWELNRAFAIELQKDIDLEVMSNGELKSFSFSVFENHSGPNDYYLICNKSALGFLIPEEKKCDYFLIIKGPLSESEESEVVKTVSESKNVLTCYPIEVPDLKSRNNLIF